MTDRNPGGSDGSSGSDVDAPPGADQADVDERLAPYLARCRRDGRETLSEHESKALLSSFDVPVVEEAVVERSDPEAAVEAADRLGYPVVVKGLDPAVAHKSEAGLVAVGLDSPAAVREAVGTISGRLEASLEDREAGRGQSEFSVGDAPASGTGAEDTHAPGSILVQPHVDGEETIVGMRLNPQFGPVVLFGLGGIAVELYDDVSLRLPPIDRAAATSMIEGTRAGALLGGFRGRPVRDVAAVRDALVAFGAFCEAADPVVAEVDVNPLVVREDGAGAVAVDALVRFVPDAVGRGDG